MGFLIGLAILGLAIVGGADLVYHKSVIQPSKVEQVNR